MSNKFQIISSDTFTIDRKVFEKKDFPLSIEFNSKTTKICNKHDTKLFEERNFKFKLLIRDLDVKLVADGLKLYFI